MEIMKAEELMEINGGWLDTVRPAVNDVYDFCKAFYEGWQDGCD